MKEILAFFLKEEEIHEEKETRPTKGAVLQPGGERIPWCNRD